jgi:hypothetical protein
MKRTSRRNLNVNLETIKRLDTKQLPEVVGGGDSGKQLPTYTALCASH